MTGAFRLEARAAGYRTGGQWLVREASLRVGPGEILGLVGPNGAGKSTLARMLAGILRPSTGEVRFEVDGEVPGHGVRARHLAYVPQAIPDAAGFRAGGIVLMGRYPHLGGLERESQRDREIVARAMAWMGVLELAGRRFGTLSGGERQRVMIARALAQAGSVVVLDEPTASLDVRHQLELLARLRQLAGEGMGFVVVLHDLELAGRWCDRLVLLHAGEVARTGVPAEVIEPGVLRQVYGLDATVEWVGGSCRVAFELPARAAAGERWRA